MKNIKLIEVPSEIGAGTRGASLGIDAIKIAALDFMSSGPITAAILEKDNAVEDFRKLIGATNPAEAADGTIRKLFATSIGENAVHGSDSNENAVIEGDFFFSKLEQF